MTTQTPATWRSRIVGHGMADPAELKANPRNWRVHPSEQSAALAGVLEEVGWVQSVVVNRRTGHLVDGHLRVDLAFKRGERVVPTIEVDLSEDEEAVILATLDPIGAMATANAERLRELLDGLEADNQAVADALEAIAREHGATAPTFPETDAGDQSRLDETKVIICPRCGHELSP